jgi:hypothetical protein
LVLKPQLTRRFIGLNNLAGFKIENYTVAVSPNPDGSNLIGQVVIPNPTNLHVDLGNTSFTLHLPPNPDPVGYATIQNTYIGPGENRLQMEAFTNQTAVLNGVNDKDGITTFVVSGNSSVYGGQHLSYFEDALKMTSIDATLNLSSVIQFKGLANLAASI